MGTLSEEMVAAMLRNFLVAKLDIEARWQEDLASRMDRPPTWRWASGTFVFPEGLCCYCGGVMQSPAIFRAVNQQYYGSWKLVRGEDGRGRFEFSSLHPHVNSGSICMGNNNYRAQSTADALFLAFNPLSSYFSRDYGPLPNEGDDDDGPSTNDQVEAWLADRFNHVCGPGQEVKVLEGVDTRHLLAPEEDCHCGNCRRHRGEIQCPREGCGQWYALRVGHGRFKCAVCDRAGNLRFCVKHKHERHDCINCGDVYDLYSVSRHGPHPEPPIALCDECKEWVCGYCTRARLHECRRLDKDSDEETVGECDHHCGECCGDHGCSTCDLCGLYPADCDC